MIRRLLFVFLDCLTLGLEKGERAERLTQLIEDLLIVNDREQVLTRDGIDRLYQLLTLRAGSLPNGLLTDVSLNIGDRLAGSFINPPEILLPWLLSLVNRYAAEVKMLRLVDLLEALIEWPEFNQLCPTSQAGFLRRLKARDLCSFGESDLTNTVLSLAQLYYTRDVRQVAA